jgi:hypothetical protein
MEQQIPHTGGTPEPESQSFFDRFVNAFAAPTDAFKGLAFQEKTVLLWLIPFLIVILITIANQYIIVSNEVLRAEMISLQERAMQKNVEKGWMTQEQADSAIEKMENQSASATLTQAAVGGVFSAIFTFFLGALGLFLIGKIAFKTPAGYMKHLAVLGLASWIGILGSIVSILMQVGFGKTFASPSLALLVINEFDIGNFTHRVYSSINTFSIWQYIVMGIGVVGLSNKSFMTGVWLGIIIFILFALAGLGISSIFI